MFASTEISQEKHLLVSSTVIINSSAKLIVPPESYVRVWCLILHGKLSVLYVVVCQQAADTTDSVCVYSQAMLLTSQVVTLWENFHVQIL